MQVFKLNDSQMAELADVDAQMKPIQDELDILDAEVQEATKIVNAIKDKIRVVRPKLIPFANAKSRIAKGGEKITK